MSQQTAVDFLKEKLTYIFINDEGFNKLFEQAKAMERKQIEEAFLEGWHGHRYNEEKLFGGRFTSPQQYYNETFKGGEQ